jgi:hypothetical protein
MRLRISALRLAACVLLSASHASAQTVVTRGWDVSVMTGVFVGRPQRFDTIDRNFDNWYNSGTFAISAARYLTPHLKAEGEVMWSAEGERFVQRYVQVPGVPGIPPYPVGANQMVKTNGVSAGLAYQFFENQWAHPFVFGGVALDFDHTRVETWPQSYYRGDPRVPGNEIPLTTQRIEDLGTSRELRAVLGTGVKLYTSQRSFFKTDARVNFGSDQSGHVSFRLGFGLDF